MQLNRFLEELRKPKSTFEINWPLNLFQESSSPLASMAQQQKQHVHIINVVEWFSQDGDELKMWCSEFDTLACRDHINLARQAMRVNVLWKQPQLLRLHPQFDQIFQVFIKV